MQWKHKKSKPIEFDKKYKVATCSYNARLGKDNYDMFVDPTKTSYLTDEDCDKTMLDVILKFLRQKEVRHLDEL